MMVRVWFGQVGFRQVTLNIGLLTRMGNLRYILKLYTLNIMYK